MAPKIKVSRHGLTRCPTCAAHIRLAARAQDTVCPFCQARLSRAADAAAPRSGLLQSALTTGRSGLLAAGLIGLSVAACAEEESNGAVYGGPPDAATADTSPSDSSDSSDSTDDDADSDDDTTPSDDATAQPAYGEPADTSPDPDGVTTEDAPDTGPVDLYGLPPDDTTP